MNKLYVCEQRGICAGLPGDPVARLLQAQYRLQQLCRNWVGPIHATPPTLEWFAQTFDIPSPFQNGIPKGCDEITYLGFKVIFDECLEDGVIFYDESWKERKTLGHAKEDDFCSYGEEKTGRN
jgi:hypothetical protein